MHAYKKIFFSQAKLQVGRPKFHHNSNLDIREYFVGGHLGFSGLIVFGGLPRFVFGRVRIYLSISKSSAWNENTGKSLSFVRDWARRMTGQNVDNVLLRSDGITQSQYGIIQVW